jgi:hypothetical protein
MKFADETGARGVLAASLRSYSADLRKWGIRLVAGYAAATALMAGGVLALFAAIAVGFAALFQWIERYCGPDVAFATIGFGLFILAIILILSGLGMLKKRVPRVPRPHSQVQAVERLAAPVALSTLMPLNTRPKDPTTRLYVGVAGAMLVYWLVASRIEAFSSGRQARR